MPLALRNSPSSRRPQCLCCFGERWDPMPAELRVMSAYGGTESAPHWQLPHRTAALTWTFLIALPSAGFLCLVAPFLVHESSPFARVLAPSLKPTR